MGTSSLESKTVRPGSLGSYSYYYSSRAPAAAHPAFIAASRRKLLPAKLLVTALVVAAVIGLPLLRGGSGPSKPAANQSNSQKAAPVVPAASAVVAAPVKNTDNCAGNDLNKLVLVSISQRHMWACDHGKTVYDAPVITGMTAYEATLTPPGTYHIYGKQTHVTLTGSDVTGSWKDPVDYWMPFLDNQYGTYGFHDATWRPADAFGNTSPDSSDASHGCVELPLASSKWLYNWVNVGTPVTIKS
jgi:lipoprotein-anchoring transpeptidase ErfK/SrfK